MAKWIRDRARKVQNGERLITFRELKGILTGHGFTLEDPAGNYIDVVKHYELHSWILGRRRRTERVMRIPYPSDGAEVGRDLVRELRKRCGLSAADGVDAEAFYARLRPTDYFVGKYRGTLRKLAKV